MHPLIQILLGRIKKLLDDINIYINNYNLIEASISTLKDINTVLNAVLNTVTAENIDESVCKIIEESKIEAAKELNANNEIINDHGKRLTEQYIKSFLLNDDTDNTIYLFLFLLFPNEGFLDPHLGIYTKIYESFLFIKNDIDYRNVKYFLIEFIFKYINLKENDLDYKRVLVESYLYHIKQENRLANNTNYIHKINISYDVIKKFYETQYPFETHLQNWVQVLNVQYHYNNITKKLEPKKL